MRARGVAILAVALLAYTASPAGAQGEPEFQLVDHLIIIQVECGARERLKIANGLDVILTLQGISSSEGKTANIEIPFDVEISPDEIVERDLGASRDIFEDDAGETASVYLSGQAYKLVCEGGNRTKPVGFSLHTRSNPPFLPDEPARMPEVGAGGLAASGAPFTAIAAAVPPLLAAAWLISRRRRGIRPHPREEGLRKQ